MPGTTLNTNLTDVVSKLVARVERLERAIQNLNASRPGSGFPVGPLTVGGVTYEIAADSAPASPGVMYSSVVAPSGTAEIVNLGSVTGGGSGLIEAVGSGTTGEVLLAALNDSSSAATIVLLSPHGGPTTITLTAAAVVMLTLPTSSPANPGQLWNNSGVVNIG
jgi:hypothetical protein